MLDPVPRHRPTAYERHAPDPRLVEQALAPARQQVFWLDDVGDAGVGPAPGPGPDATVRADLAIVGGGYLGLWAAVLAARRDPGRRIVLVEAETLGSAASGRNGGFCEASITHGEENGRSRWPDEYDVLERLGVENLAAFESDVRSWGLDCQWERTGTLTVAVEPHEVGWLDGAPGPMDAAAVREQIDSPLFLAGSWEREHTALVHPARLARELGRVAAEAGVEIIERSPVLDLDAPVSRSSGPVTLRTARGRIEADRVVLATNVFPSLLRRVRPFTVPVYDYVLMTEPLSRAQLASIGWTNRQGLADQANQFHYSRLTHDDRILYGGYDAVYFRGGRLRADYEDRPESFARLASHLLATFPQLEGLTFTHKWAGAIDTCTRFAPFFGTARQGRVAYAAGFTGLGVGSTRFAAEVLLDLLAGDETERTALEMVRRKPLPFPPEPAASIGINLTRWSLDRADHREGRRNLFLRTLDRVGLGFDS
jgi:glycine/D-amino acid oxidase-like deaminating enzyme